MISLRKVFLAAGESVEIESFGFLIFPIAGELDIEGDSVSSGSILQVGGIGLTIVFARIDASFVLCKPQEELKFPPTQRKKFTEAERDSILCLLSSPDGRFGSLKSGSEDLLYTSVIKRGESIRLRAMEGRSYFFKILSGALEIDGEEFIDSCTIEDPASMVCLSGKVDAEFLMIDHPQKS